LESHKKVTKTTTHFEVNRIKVVQALSESVCNSSKFAKDLNLEGFQGRKDIAQFCLNFNNAFEIRNCKNKFSRDRFRAPLNEVNYTATG
jgi:hypothetical protein